jgi:hypothetical protein
MRTDEVRRHGREIQDRGGTRSSGGGQYMEQFESLVRETIRSGTIDMTGWSWGAVRVLLVVAGEENVRDLQQRGQVHDSGQVPRGADD